MLITHDVHRRWTRYMRGAVGGHEEEASVAHITNNPEPVEDTTLKVMEPEQVTDNLMQESNWGASGESDDGSTVDTTTDSTVDPSTSVALPPVDDTNQDEVDA